MRNPLPRAVVAVLVLSCACHANNKFESKDTGAPMDDDPADEADTADTAEPDEDCDDETPVALYLSPDDSNSMSSPVILREAVLAGWASLRSVPLRTWEFMNYYTFPYDPAPYEELAVNAALLTGDDTLGSDTWTLQIGVSSPSIPAEARAPMDVTFVLDTSGSMSGHPIEMLQASCRAIARSLRSGDTVSMVTWDVDQRYVLDSHPVDGPGDAVLLDAIDRLEAGGTTDLESGLEAGYRLASKNWDPTHINRLVLISDGGANVGVTDEDIIARHAGSNDEDGIYLVGVGVGTVDTYNDLLMDTVTDVGKGASVFIPSEEEAARVFVDDFMSTMAIAARDVAVRVDLPPGFKIVRFSGEEISTDPREVEPQHIAPDDAVVFYQTLETCAPEAVTPETEITVTVHYRDAITFEERSTTRTWSFGELASADPALLWKGAAVYAYAESVKALAFHGDREAIGQALDILSVARDANPGDTELDEIAVVLEELE